MFTWGNWCKHTVFLLSELHKQHRKTGSTGRQAAQEDRQQAAGSTGRQEDRRHRKTGSAQPQSVLSPVG